VSGGYYETAEAHALTLGRGDRVQLSGTTRLHLSLSQRYRIIEASGDVGPWKVTTVGYFYEIADSTAREIVSFQWHPDSQSPVTWPHFHLGPGAEVGHERLSSCHVPSGRISVEQVLRLVIELGAETLRTDWDDVLTASQETYEQWRSWA
jgi:hypothetical protein